MFDLPVVEQQHVRRIREVMSLAEPTASMMVVKDKAGTESTIYWNADTKVEGDGPKEGEKVWFTATEKDGKMWATWVKSGAAKAKM